MPDIQLSTAVHAVERGISLEAALELAAAESQPMIVNASASHIDTDVLDTTVLANEASTSPQESEYEGVDTLDWDETDDVAAAADGIGSLSMNTKGIGYMGPQSGNALLRKLQSISILYFTPYDDLTLQRSPEPGVPDHIIKSPQFINQCIDWYFRYYHCAYPILHEGHFRAQLMGMAVFRHVDRIWLTKDGTRRITEAERRVMACTAQHSSCNWCSLWRALRPKC